PGLHLSGRIRYQAIGPVAAMVPWNGPLVIAAWKLAPALAAGCSIVLKPSELTPLSTVYLGELLQEAGVPDGIVNIVHGARDVGAQLARHEDIRKLSFTGSTATGKKLIAAAAGNMKRLTLELGGKSPVIVLDDADIESAIDGAADAIFGNAGQVCVAGSRIYVHETIHSHFLQGLCDRAAALKTGSPWSSETTLGPLISEAHRNSVHAKVERAVADGATLLAGGYPLDGAGYFYPATVLSDVHADMDIVCEEVFGPVVTVSSFSSDEDAIAMANDSNYGLAASVWSRDLAKANALGEQLEAGIVWLNCHGIPDPSMPIGGMKSSGWGRELGVEGLKSYLEMQSFMTRS
ncbi:MAG: aldehyde dehydrogenase family protein, partial [Pseudomonadota bacterium]